MNITDDAILIKSYSLPSDNSDWVMNSFVFDHNLYTKTFVSLNYILIAFCGFIIIHSAYLNGRNVNYVTCAVNIQATLGIIYSIMFCVSFFFGSNPTKSAICYDLIANGITILGIQLIDNYFFIERFLCISKIPMWKKAFVHSFICLYSYGPYLGPSLYSSSLWL